MMSPHKRRLYPLLVLSLFVLFLFSYYHSSLPHTAISNIPSSSNLPQSRSNIVQKFTLTIKLLAFDRFDSIARCLRSLANADYVNDRVNLHVYIDHFKETNQSSILDEKLEESHRILDFVDKFVWKFGEKFVHFRTGNVGLQAQWLESWWPSSDDEFAFVVEDDLEVSPLYYKFLKGLVVNYYYNSSNYSPSIYGASLQRPRFVPGKHGNKIQLDTGTRLFLYQLVGTWGQLLFPRPWKEFRLWYNIHKAKGIKPVLQGMVTTGWYKRMGERIWTPWFIKFIHSRGYFNIYTNFQGERALSVSHRDAGVNYGKTAGPDSNLLDEDSLDFNYLEMQHLTSLKWYDFCFREVLPGKVVRTSDELSSLLYSARKKYKTIILISLHRTSQAVTMNMLCHFEKLNIQNYIFLGPNSDLLNDLARRGYPVISTEFVNNIKGFRSKKFEGSDMLKEILAKAYIIKLCLHLELNSWVIDGNMLPISNAMFSDLHDTAYFFFATKDSDVFLVKSSSVSAKIWDDSFIDKVVVKAISLKNRSSKDHGYLGNAITRSLEEIDGKIKTVGELSFAEKVDVKNANQTRVSEGTKYVFWSDDMGLDFIRSRLDNLGMWELEDNSCKAVVCHQS
ncbi:hypothetical protein C5167_029710 [Papaver somniferum]|uniref:uncharacterized protein LOC113337932 n=1 Tax=Papaver somniferum TaxID=3469 RepID=UPI000E7059E8|nr:uncharacterized protein LOC113337932 [Papaver somniferum]XP_026439253.1 uncharacterized protein LOC113337932 [Papaver somniferum]RZC90577.1 hypothetical protein C5167_029710 [Papaver somniferum]